MKKMIGLVAILLVCASNLFAYVYWEFDGVQPPSKKATIFHTTIAHENIKNVKGYSEYFNDHHNESMKDILDGLPPAKEYREIVGEVVDIYCRNGKFYRISYTAFTNNYGYTTYYVNVFSSDHGKDNVYSKSGQTYNSNGNGKWVTVILRTEYEKEHYSFNAMKNDFERLKSKYIDKL